MAEHKNGTGRNRSLAELQAQLETLEKKLEPRVAELLANGRKRLSGLLDRAEAAGSEALDSVVRLQNTAVGALGLASRNELEDLTRRVKRLAKQAARLRAQPPTAAKAEEQTEPR
jgi:hypothetical protein